MGARSCPIRSLGLDSQNVPKCMYKNLKTQQFGDQIYAQLCVETVSIKSCFDKCGTQQSKYPIYDQPYVRPSVHPSILLPSFHPSIYFQI